MKSVSVVVPIYNGENVISRCLDSLLEQTLEDIEIICIDDGSTDSSVAILEGYAQKSDKITILRGNHEGVFAARRLGIENANGKYIGFCDVDDYVDSGMYEKMFRAALESESDIVVCAYDRVRPDGAKTEMDGWGNRTFKMDDFYENLPIVNTAIWNKIIRKEIAGVDPGFEKNPRVAEDMMYLLHVYAKSSRISFVNESLYKYIVSDGSAMSYVREDELLNVKQAMEKTVQNVLEIRNADVKLSKEQWMGVMAAFSLVHLGVSLPLRLVCDNWMDYSICCNGIMKWLEQEFPKWRKCKFNGKIKIIQMLAKLKILYPMLFVYRRISPKLGMIGW